MIVIAGAGIGGLTLGCALARTRTPFRIFERAPELRPVGAGIALSSNAFQALAHIGMEEAVRKCGWELTFGEIGDWQGEPLFRFQIRDLSTGGMRAMTRAALHQTLLHALGSSVETGRTVAGYQSHQDRVRIRMADGEEIEAAILVGADGLHSTVRRAMRGEEPLRYCGQTSWRGIVNGVKLKEPGGVRESWGPGQRFGIVPVSADQVYWFAVANEPAHQRDSGNSSAQLKARFEGWHEPIDEILSKTPSDQIIRTDIFDRIPIDNWIDGRAVLLGDAAHPMTPNMGMGACQAIEDAIVLADALGRNSNIDAALLDYQKRRIPRANSFVKRSFQFGRIAQLRNRPLRWLRDGAMRSLALAPTQIISRAAARDFNFRL